ncbi:MAG TPA: tetratricopeptide repeat protein [Cyclobacteriaceae bacterium]|nr:tetratricopeptide repeat protein [Cyclobacteriaceae bacterium]
MKRASFILVASFLAAFSVNGQTPHIDSLLTIVARHKKDTTEVKVYSELGVEFARKDIARQRQLLYQGITLSKQLNSFFITGLYSLLTVSHQATGNMDSARHYLELLKQASTADPKNKRAFISYNQTAGLFYKNSGQPREALLYLKRTFDATTDSTAKAGMMLNIGNTYTELGDLNNAAASHLKSLALFEKVGNKRGQSFAYQGLGSDYLKMQQWKKAGIYYEKSLKLKEQLNDRRGIINAQGGMGNVSMELGDYPAAIAAFEAALKTATEMSLVADQGEATHELAQVYRRMGNMEKSKEYYRQALGFVKQVDDKSWAASIESQLLQIETETKSKEQMEAGLQKSLTQYQEAGDKIGVANSHHNLAEFYSKQKDYKNAFEHLYASTLLEDSTRGMSVDERLRELETQYANEKRDREMALFKKDQELKTADLERQQAVQAGVIIALISVLVIGLLLVNRYQVVSRARRTAEIERMRNAIARDLHDDIGSTLSSINIMSQLAIREGNGEASKHFGKIAEQSGRMMESMSDIVWSISPGNDSLEQVVAKMKEFAAEILEPKNITYRFTGDDSLKDTSLSLEKRKNLFLIFKEAVNNAAKYSGATDLEIIFARHGNTLSLSVSDNGGGFEPERVKNGNGLKNMKERALALKARFNFVTRVSEGTRIALELPIT